jgi:indole-3-glycerol phosphate synthase
MASVLTSRDKGQRLFDLASELGLDVLYEAHTQQEIDRIPDGVKIFGINSRNFMGKWRRNTFINPILKLLQFPIPDFSTSLAAFSLIKNLPENAIKVAESGINPKNISDVMKLGYKAALIGTSLLQDHDGIDTALSKFEEVIVPNYSPAATAPAVHAHA